MYFDDDYLETLQDEPFDALVDICDRYAELYTKFRANDDFVKVRSLMAEACALLKTIGERLYLTFSLPDRVGHTQADIDEAHDHIMSTKDEITRMSTEARFKRHENLLTTKWGMGFYYEFSEGDLDRIQELINELRDLISASEELEDDHKQRVLSKLEKLQSELHKKVKDLDRFWGFFIDASIVVGLMGENAKPMVDVIQKIVRIIWPTQTRAYELPSDFPLKLLGQAEDDKTVDEKS